VVVVDCALRLHQGIGTHVAGDGCLTVVIALVVMTAPTSERQGNDIFTMV